MVNEAPFEYPGVQIRLTLSELLMACSVGAVRHHESVSSGRRDANGFTDRQSGLSVHIEGAAGELAVAHVWNLHFAGHVNTFKGADLGERTQVKCRSQHNYELIVRKDDSSDHIFVLVTGSAPNFFVRGWLYGHEAKHKDFLATHGDREAAYFVPHGLLHSMEMLPE